VLKHSDQLEAKERTVVVVGATSKVGSELSAKLVRAGHNVKGVARSLGVSLRDQDALNRTFAGADSAFVMIPFDLQASDLHAFEREVGERVAKAISVSGVGRVVLLSGLNAHLKMGTSWGAAAMEERLEMLGLSELVFLRAGFFNENLIKGMSFVEQAKSGIFATPFTGDRPMPLVAASDIGERAAEILTAQDWPKARVVELHGSGYHTLAEATAILGRVIGREVVYQAAPEIDARAAMINGGLPPSFADAVLETAASFNRGDRWALEAPGPGNMTPTTLEAWAKRALGNEPKAASA
jgi:uncharacterized protein YbjT (DUF2867 family)